MESRFMKICKLRFKIAVLSIRLLFKKLVLVPCELQIRSIMKQMRKDGYVFFDENGKEI